MSAWNGWYHCTGSTYGTWVRGDPRGWRSREHREHVDGDYVHPPRAGKYDRQHKRSLGLMRREWVVLTPMQRQFACDALAAALHEQEVEIIAFCVGAKHWHGLLRFRDPEKHCGQDRDARVLIGFAKGKTARAMSRAVIIEPGGVWGKKCRVRPVRNRAHHLNIVKYILVHEKKGAAISYLPKSAKPGASAPGPCTP